MLPVIYMWESHNPPFWKITAWPALRRNDFLASVFEM
jgi:hypothetical protein